MDQFFSIFGPVGDGAPLERIIIVQVEKIPFLVSELSQQGVCRQNILDSWLGNLRECLAHLV